MFVKVGQKETSSLSAVPFIICYANYSVDLSTNVCCRGVGFCVSVVYLLSCRFGMLFLICIV